MSVPTLSTKVIGTDEDGDKLSVSISFPTNNKWSTNFELVKKKVEKKFGLALNQYKIKINNSLIKNTEQFCEIMKNSDPDQLPNILVISCNGDVDEKEVECKSNDLYSWCEEHGFHKYYGTFKDELGFEEIEDLLQCTLSDAVLICHDLKFTQDEKKRLLKIIIKNNPNNDLKIWCDSIKLPGIYQPLLDKGYFGVDQLSSLSSTDFEKLCTELGLKFGKKVRFKNSIRKDEKKQQREIVVVKTVEQIKDDFKNNKTIMVVGETGSGKSTTINSMMNYLYDAQFNGNRYKLIDEEQLMKAKKKQSGSTTADVVTYIIDPPMVDFSLTIVDTPGFADTKGLGFDESTIGKLKSLFETKVTEMNAICFVVKASETRLTTQQLYVFNQVINLFGNDVKENIIILFTFASKGKPLGLVAVNDMKIPFRKYFQLDNDGFVKR